MKCSLGSTKYTKFLIHPNIAKMHLELIFNIEKCCFNYELQLNAVLIMNYNKYLIYIFILGNPNTVYPMKAQLYQSFKKIIRSDTCMKFQQNYITFHILCDVNKKKFLKNFNWGHINDFFIHCVPCRLVMSSLFLFRKKK
jgi:hypothetical protein